MAHDHLLSTKMTQFHSRAFLNLFILAVVVLEFRGLYCLGLI